MLLLQQVAGEVPVAGRPVHHPAAHGSCHLGPPVFMAHTEQQAQAVRHAQGICHGGVGRVGSLH